MSVVHRALNYLLDIIYTNRFPNIGKSCRINHKSSVSNKYRLYLGNHCSIGPRADILNSRASVYIGSHFMSGPRLVIITGDHMPMLGRFLDTISDKDKDLIDIDHKYDKDVVIHDDVWAGYDVKIMKGVTISRGVIIASGSVVTHFMPPYCVCGGIPARFIRFRWSVDQILAHEIKLYPEHERYSREQLERFYSEYQIYL